jgi:hypothetical protein
MGDHYHNSSHGMIVLANGIAIFDHILWHDQEDEQRGNEWSED